MSPIPFTGVITQDVVLETLDTLGYVAVGYLLAAILHSYFAQYRQWIVGLLILPLSPSIKGRSWNGTLQDAPSRFVDESKADAASGRPLRTTGNASITGLTASSLPATMTTLKLLSRNLDRNVVEQSKARSKNGDTSKENRRHKRLQGSLLSTVKV
ncbi:hypothetical protein NMY22_g15137 [Coprinellus aureogranulatus]|nr:hypothetical protein NMY22_g15137 [Coprinellus aureogranulatus]